jgi:C1A family cysteine protease
LIVLPSLAVSVHAASAPDLTVENIWLDASQVGQPITEVSPGQSFNIIATIRNIGQETASGYYLDVYYDSDYGRGGPDNIAPGEVQTWYVGPLTAQDGTHTTKWIVDPDNQIAELDEGNNQKEYTFTIGSETTNTTTVTSNSTSSTTQLTSTSTSSLPVTHALGWLPEEIPKDARVTPIVSAALPTHFDWTQKDGKNWMTTVENQEGCGSCVAFAAVGALEGQLKIQANNPSWNIDLSEQHLFSCGGGTCSGGWYISSALRYLQQYGTPDEACSPYQGGSGSCSNSCPNWQSRAYKISSWNWVLNDPSAIEAAVMNGPVVAGFDVYTDFFSYSGGVYHYDGHSPWAGGHAVVIVGYDSNEQYWIAKNSWGSWGKNGYFKIGFGEAGIENYVASINAVATSVQHTVTFSTNRAQATISADEVTMINGATAAYSAGQRVHVVANPPNGYLFSSWEVSGGSLDNRLSRDTYLTVSGDGMLKANFDAQVSRRAGLSQPYLLGFKVTDIHSDSHTGDFPILTTSWSSSGAEFQITLAQGESLFLIGTAQVWNDYGSIGSSIGITRDGVTVVSGDMFAAGATITSRELASAVAVDTPGAGTYTYSLSAKTDPGGKAWVSQPYLLAFKVPSAYSSSHTGDYYTSSTGWWSTGTEFSVSLGAGESLFLIGTAQVWNDYASIGSSIAICKDGARISGDMFAAGATITNRELATAVAIDTPATPGTFTYSLSAKTDPGGRAGASQPYLLAFKVSSVYSNLAEGDHYVTATSWSSSGATLQASVGDGESMFLIGTAQLWNEYSTIGSSIAICSDDGLRLTRVSGDMFAAGATITNRELGTAIAVQTPSAAGTYTYTLCGKTD